MRRRWCSTTERRSSMPWVWVGMFMCQVHRVDVIDLSIDQLLAAGRAR